MNLSQASMLACAFQYCDKPSGWAEGHHIKHWGQDGLFRLDNLILLCSQHHHVHCEDIPIEIDTNGIPRIKLEYRYRCLSLQFFRWVIGLFCPSAEWGAPHHRDLHDRRSTANADERAAFPA